MRYESLERRRPPLLESAETTPWSRWQLTERTLSCGRVVTAPTNEPLARAGGLALRNPLHAGRRVTRRCHRAIPPTAGHRIVVQRASTISGAEVGRQRGAGLRPPYAAGLACETRRHTQRWKRRRDRHEHTAWPDPDPIAGLCIPINATRFPPVAATNAARWHCAATHPTRHLSDQGRQDTR